MRIAYDAARGELTVYHRNGHVSEETFLHTARRQVDALARHGYARAVPILSPCLATSMRLTALGAMPLPLPSRPRLGATSYRSRWAR